MGRAPCCDKANVKKGPWSPEEDAKLKSYIETHGTGGNWITLPQKIGLKRCGKSCRLRWLNYLRPNLKHGDFSEEEDNIICSLYIAIGSRWSIMAGRLPGRTDNEIKNHWNTKLKKKLFGKKSNPNLQPPQTSREDYRQPNYNKQRNPPPTSRCDDGGDGAGRRNASETPPQPAPPCHGALAPAVTSSSSYYSAQGDSSGDWLSATEELDELLGRFESAAERMEELENWLDVDGVEQCVDWIDEMMRPSMASSSSSSSSSSGGAIQEVCDGTQCCWWPPLEEELQMGTSGYCR